MTRSSLEILGLLAEKPGHGYDLGMRHAESFGDRRRMPYGHIYATLKRLERDELARSIGTERSSGPDRTIYGITEAGRDRLSEWLSTLGAAFTIDDVLSKTVIAMLPPRSSRESVQILTKYVTELEVSVSAERRGGTKRGLLAQVSLTYDIAWQEASITWLRSVIDQNPGHPSILRVPN